MSAVLATGLALVLGCGDDKMDAGADAGAGSGDSGVPEQKLYDRLGRELGITAVITDFVNRVLADPKINGYFLNSSVNGQRLTKCLIKFVGAASGGPQTYPSGTAPADADGCRNMKEAHAGLGISSTDFNDLAGHLVAALNAAGIAQADVMMLTDALGALVPVIVEAPNNNETIYQRIGRKPAIDTVVGNFITRVLANPAINGYFLNSGLNAARLRTCLVRQVCGATGGPCKYGMEAGAELFDGNACRAMRMTHMGLGISQADFSDLVVDLVTELTAAGVAQADIDAIAGVLGPLAPDIVENPMSNENIYQRIGRKPGVAVVVGDFAARVLADNTLNGFFATTDANRLGVCLIRQVCGATGGPCKYGMEAGPELLNNVPCRDMAATHATLRNGGAAISKADFDALVGHLVDAMTAANVASADRTAIVNALAPLCPSIVANGTGC